MTELIPCPWCDPGSRVIGARGLLGSFVLCKACEARGPIAVNTDDPGELPATIRPVR